MSNKKLTILAIIAAVMIGWSIVQSKFANRHSGGPAVSINLVQGLDLSLIDTISVKSGKMNSVTLKRNKNEFVIVENDNYPALTNEVNKLITSTLEINTSELYTVNPENHKDLGVAEEDANYVVKFFKSDSSPLAGVVVGKTKEQGGGTFVRLTSNDRVYVTYKDVMFNYKATDYIDKKLFSLNSSQITSITVNSPDNSYTLKKVDHAGEIKFIDLPEEKKLKTEVANEVFAALNDLSFTDVKMKTPENLQMGFEHNFVCTLKDSTVFAVNIAKKDEKVFITCKSNFTDTTPVVKDKDVETEEELKKKESKLLANENSNKFTIKHSSWIYEISEYDSRNLMKTIDELLEDDESDSVSDSQSDATLPLPADSE